MSNSDSDSNPVHCSDLIKRMKKELSEIRISLLESATDYISTVTELSLHDEDKESERKSEHLPASGSRSVNYDTTEKTDATRAQN